MSASSMHCLLSVSRNWDHCVLSHRSLLIRNTFFDCFILTRIEVECLSAIDAAPARDIELWHIVRYRYDELSTQRDHRELNQHVHHPC